MSKNKHILIGRIVGVHGIKGCLRICSYAESDVFFAEGSSVLLKNSSAEICSHTIRQSAPYKLGLLLHLDGIEDRDMAESLVGSGLFIERSALPQPEEGSYYWHDLIGISVFDAESGFLGKLTAVMPTGSNDVYVVKDGKKETLVPALVSVVTGIDLESGTMQVQLPEGL
ncbi:MAG: ribosome maturation factor RimM [Desulfococcaceae bacterium]